MQVSAKWLSDGFCGLSCVSNENHNSGSSGGNTLWVQVPSSAPGKSQNLFGFWLFLYDDVELKPLKKKGSPKIQKGFLGKRSGNEAASAFYFNKMPLSGVSRDESPIIRTKRRATVLPLLFFFCKWDLNQTGRRR